MKNQETAWLLKEKYHGVESESFRADCARLAVGEPLAYLIGHVPFLDCTIYLDSLPLIPRPETEYWVERAIIEIKKQLNKAGLPRFARKDEASALPQTNLRDSILNVNSEVRGRTPYLKILDLCAGSGAIGVAVTKAEPSARVTFAELDPSHLPTIEKNLKVNTIADPAINRWVEKKNQIILADLFEELQQKSSGSETAINRCLGQFDFILTNPPYIDAEAHTVDDNVALHEPHLALFGGVAGMDIITRIIIEAPQYLTPTGQLWIEHEPAQVEAIALLAVQNNFSIITHPDQYGIPRFSVLTMAQ